VVNVDQIPRTAEEVQAIRIKLKDLRSELQDAASRRQNLAGQLRRMDDRASKGVEDRLQVLDARIVQIEKDITANGALLKSAPAAALVAERSLEPDPAKIMAEIGDNIIPLVAILSVFVFAPFAFTVSRFIWKRSIPSSRRGFPDQAGNQKLDQLQQSVDTIAIEVERISEGQRFVTRLLSERDGRALGAGAAEPIRSQAKAAVPSER
jgi:chaperonin cofactor prefoldin